MSYTSCAQDSNVDFLAAGLKFGAFADDHHLRNELGPFARARAKEHHGEEFPPERIYVIGDTPLDIECGRAFGAKTVYRPIEAAIRCAGLMRFEQKILDTLGPRVMPEPNEFPRWPMLLHFCERIFDALTHGELPYGKAGMAPAAQRPSLDDPALIVRHVDLKAWIMRYYPGDRPSFLFEGIERWRAKT